MATNDVGPGKTVVTDPYIEGLNLCVVENCETWAHCRGMCKRHYSRWYRHGDPNINLRPARHGTDLSALAQIDNPIALALRVLAHKGLLGGRDSDDYLDVAIQAIVTAALTWQPSKGPLLNWAWLHAGTAIKDEQRRTARRWNELGRERCVSDGEWLQARNHDEYTRIDLRIDLQRWADLAGLSDHQRWLLDYVAHHTSDRGGPNRQHRSAYSTAMKHMRRAAVTGRRRDDEWTRARARREADAA